MAEFPLTGAHPFRIVAGEDRLRMWKPDDGGKKWFCGDCGSAIFARSTAHATPIGIRMGTAAATQARRPSQSRCCIAAWRRVSSGRQSTIFQNESLRLILPSVNSKRSHPRTSMRSPVTWVPLIVHSDTPRSPQVQWRSSP
jgi:hypothetical protein